MGLFQFLCAGSSVSARGTATLPHPFPAHFSAVYDGKVDAFRGPNLISPRDPPRGDLWQCGQEGAGWVALIQEKTETLTCSAAAFAARHLRAGAQWCGSAGIRYMTAPRFCKRQLVLGHSTPAYHVEPMQPHLLHAAHCCEVCCSQPAAVQNELCNKRCRLSTPPALTGP